MRDLDSQQLLRWKGNPLMANKKRPARTPAKAVKSAIGKIKSKVKAKIKALKKKPKRGTRKKDADDIFGGGFAG